MPVYFSPPCKCRGRNQTNEGVRVCVQSLGASIFQLINFIFTHLFLNVLSDGNAAGCSSEVLTWQMGLKRGSQPVSEAGFQFKVSFFFSFIIHEKWELSMASSLSVQGVLLIQYKSYTWSVWCCNAPLGGKHIFKDSGGEELLMYVFFPSLKVCWLTQTDSFIAAKSLSCLYLF